MRLRPWREGDAPAVDRLLAETWGHDPVGLAACSVHGRANDEPGARRRTLLADVHDRVAGVGTAREYWLHPTRWRLSILVRSTDRRGGIGGSLFAGLDAWASALDRRPWQAATRADDEPGRRFLARLGFVPLMRTRLGLLDPREIGPLFRLEAAAAATRIESRGYRVKSFPDAARRPEEERLLASLHGEIYRLGHAWSPTVQLSPEKAAGLFLAADDVIPSAMFVAWAGDVPAAVASLRVWPPVPPVDLGWVGAAAAFASDAPDLVLSLLGRCCQHASTAGWSIRVEIDEADRLVSDLAARLPIRWEPDWLTVVRESGGAVASAAGDP